MKLRRSCGRRRARSALVRELLDRVYAALAGDSSVIRTLISDDPDVVGIGTDPEEFWTGETLARTWEKQIEELGSSQITLGVRNEEVIGHELTTQA